MFNRTSINGFTLFEFFMSLVVIAVITGIVIPIVMNIVKVFGINAFKNDAYNVIEATKIYVAEEKFDDIPEEGIEISKLNLNLKNNNFDGGIIKKVDNDYKVINLTRKNYCASGTSDDMKVSNKGCGALDDTEPVNARVAVKEADGRSLTVIGVGTDNESKIVGYEFNIDGSNFTKISEKNEFTFKNINGYFHTIRVRVTNEAGLTTVSDNIKINLKEYSHITCYERNGLESYQISKTALCKYPTSYGYKYQYSLDNNTWKDISLSDGVYKFSLRDNQPIYTRVIEDNKTIAYNTIKTSNIDITLAGSYPELYENMIPVIYDSDKKAWIKADSRLKYFDYDNKIWANVVYVRRNKDVDDINSHNRDYYLSDNAIGQVIYDKDIIAQYVWIPRFRYKLFNISDIIKDPVLIDILFEGKNMNVLNNTKDGTYLTHKAFIYDEDKNGFWVSKYQSNVSTTSSCYSDNTTCDKSDLLIYATNSEKKITNISISNAHLSTKNMNSIGNIYGMNSEEKPHVLTNLEYGAILYLTNSKYGIGEANYTYSTTGNMSGVFDLNSNYPEMVMGNYNNDSGLNENNNSGFKDYGSVEWPNYIDYYKGITSKNRLLGDATGETNNWYNGYSKFVSGEAPFFIRGGIIEGVRSIYNYSSFTGCKNESYTFRTALIK